MMMRKLKNYCKQTKGSVIIEFVLLLPIMIMIFAVIWDFTNFVLINNKLVRIGATIANDITLQETIGTADIQNIFNTANIIMTPYTFTGSGGALVASQIRPNPNNANALIIGWQIKSGATNSRFGAAGGAPANLPNNITTLPSDQRIVAIEVFYTYNPLFQQSLSFLGTKSLYKVSLFIPRIGTLDTLTPN